ncbi:hypothetical protein HMPREF1555_01265 [Porphyromonas gingivalis F0570]|uniref:Uncharacterized protein n=2 Tax=Porphyromonas gingivalis TaxID=837 RepID=A0A0E2LQY3_PORGN|nr:hypothetical protein HMPREF1555_01265 [Porphyromonas gingivalis F0570]
MMVFHVHSLFVYRRQFDVRKDQWSYRKNAVQWSLISPWAMLYFFSMAYLLRGCRGILPQCEDARNRSNVSTRLLIFLTSPIPYTSVRKNGGLAFGKMWRVKFFVLAREVKILRATTEKFSLVNLRKLEPHSGQFRNQIREESAYNVSSM